MQDNTAQNEKRAPLSCSLETAAAVIAERCFADKAFGENFLQDPQTALARQNIKTGKRQVHAHENDARNWHIVLPDLKAREAASKYTDEELKAMKDADLRKLSGGEVVVAMTVAVGVTAGVASAVVVGGAVGAAEATSKKKK